MGKYVFVLDNAPYHKSSKILKYLQGIGEDIKVEFLSLYSPEPNRNMLESGTAGDHQFHILPSDRGYNIFDREFSWKSRVRFESFQLFMSLTILRSNSMQRLNERKIKWIIREIFRTQLTKIEI